MFTSDNSPEKRRIAKIGFTYLLISVFCAFFGAVYEHFSHEVYSGYMIYAFAFPLVGGALPFLSMALFKCPTLPDRIAFHLYNAGIASVTVGSIMEGVLAIYGTTNDLLKIYWYVGGTLIVGGIVLYIFHSIVDRRNKADEFIKNRSR